MSRYPRSLNLWYRPWRSRGGKSVEVKTLIDGARRPREIAAGLLFQKIDQKGENIMKRREFLKTAGAGLAASTAVAAPAIAQSMPELKWRCTTSWPKSLDVPFSASETISKYVAEATDNKFQIQAFAGGEIVPALQAVDAVTNGTVEMCHTAAYYFIGKDPTFALYCSIPFGLNSRQQNAWFQDHGGQDMLNEFGKKHKLYGISGGNTGTQMGGWFRKEINTVNDLNGLKMRIGGGGGGKPL